MRPRSFTFMDSWQAATGYDATLREASSTVYVGDMLGSYNSRSGLDCVFNANFPAVPGISSSLTHERMHVGGAMPLERYCLPEREAEAYVGAGLDDDRQLHEQGGHQGEQQQQPWHKLLLRAPLYPELDAMPQQQPVQPGLSSWQPKPGHGRPDTLQHVNNRRVPDAAAAQ